jgi:hypothetical protein
MKSSKLYCLLLVSVFSFTAKTLQAAPQGLDLFDESVIHTLRIDFTDPAWPEVLGAYDAVDNAPALPVTFAIDGGAPFLGDAMYAGGWSYFITNWNLMNVGKAPWELELLDEISDMDELRLKNGRSLIGDVGHMRKAMALRIFRRHTIAARTAFLATDVSPHPIYRPTLGALADPASLGVYLLMEHVDSRFRQRQFFGGGDHKYEFNNFITSNLGTFGLPQGIVLSGGDQDVVWNCVDDNCPYTPIQDLNDFLMNSPFGPGTPEYRADLSSQFDVDAHMWFMACWLAVQNADGMQSKLIHDGQHDRLVPLPHDVNDCFAPAGYNHDIAPPVIFGDLTNSMMQDPDLGLRFLHHMRHVVQRSLQPSFNAALGPVYRDLLTDHPDGTEWNMFPASHTFFGLDTGLPLADEAVLLTANETSFNLHFDAVMAAMQSRYITLIGHPALNRPQATIDTVQHQPFMTSTMTPRITARVLVTPGAKVTLFWRSQGAFQAQPMNDAAVDGDYVAGDYTYTGELPQLSAGSTLEYYIEVITNYVDGENVFDPASLASASYYPVSAERDAIQVPIADAWFDSPLRINEFLVGDGGSDTEEWIEIYNTSPTQTVVLTAFSLDDDLEGALTDPLDLDTFYFGKGEVLAPLGFVRVFTNSDSPGSGGATFDLKHKKGHITLRAADGALVDVHSYLRQSEGISEGRLVDGMSVWTKFTVPTPKLSNGMPTDLNSDGKTNTADLLIILGALGQASIGQVGDLNGDWVVDMFDIELLTLLMTELATQ